MSSKSWQLCVQDILAAIAEIRQRTTGMPFEDFERDRTIVKAVLYDFVVIGEAARNIPSKIQSRFPQIPWRLIVNESLLQFEFV